MHGLLQANSCLGYSYDISRGICCGINYHHIGKREMGEEISEESESSIDSDVELENPAAQIFRKGVKLLPRYEFTEIFPDDERTAKMPRLCGPANKPKAKDHPDCLAHNEIGYPNGVSPPPCICILPDDDDKPIATDGWSKRGDVMRDCSCKSCVRRFAHDITYA